MYTISQYNRLCLLLLNVHNLLVQWLCLPSLELQNSSLIRRTCHRPNKILWPHLSLPKLPLPLPQQFNQNNLNLITRKESTRTRMIPVSKVQWLWTRRYELVFIFISWDFAKLVEAEAIKLRRGQGVRLDSGRKDGSLGVVLDSPGSKTKTGSCWEGMACGEG